MKNVKYLILVIFIMYSCQSKTQEVNIEPVPETESQDSLSIQYNYFIEKFDTNNIFSAYSMLSVVFPYKQSMDNLIIKKYICNNVNYCLKTKNYQMNRFYYMNKYQMNENIDIIVYGKQELPFHQQIILATYSKKDLRKINEIVIWSSDNFEYQIHSVVSDDFKIKTTNIYTNFHTTEPLIENDPYKYFYIKKLEQEYVINDNGEILLIREGKVEKHLSTIKDGNFLYPVEIPKND